MKPLPQLFLLIWLGAGAFPTTVLAQAGVPLWTNRFNGTGNGADTPTAVTVGGDNNVYVTGHSRGTSTRLEYATVAYSSAGTPLWTNRHAGTGSFDSFAQAIVAGDGKVYVTGFSGNTGSSYDYATLAYSSAGIPLWTNRYTGPGNNFDWPSGLAVSPDNGNVYVTGYSSDLTTDNDYLTIAYSSTGTALWTNRYGGFGVDSPSGLVVASNGNIIVTGTSSHDYVTIAYSSTGTTLWTNRYNGLGNTDNTSALAEDGSGNIFVTGSSLVTGSGYDYLTVAYSAAGTALWTNRYDGPINGDDFAAGVATDRNGHVYVTGWSEGLAGADYLTIAYSTAGTPLWTNRYNGPESDYDQAHALAVDATGNVYVTGLSYDSSSGFDYATIAYTSSGSPLWTNRYNGTGNGEDQAFGITVDSSGNVLVTGSSTGIGSGTDFVTIKYAGQNPSAIPLQIQKTGNQVVLTWTDARFGLQSAPAATGTFTNVPNAINPFTNSINGTQQFFRLKAN